MSKEHVPIDIDDVPSITPQCGPITRIEISPNGNYLVAYSKQSSTMVGWNVEDIEEGKDLDMKEGEDLDTKKNDMIEVKLYDETHICVSDDKILAYIDK